MPERRFVTALIILPEQYNADDHGHRKPVEQAKFGATALELSRRFGGGFLLRYSRDVRQRGFWWDRGVLHDDENCVFEVDFEDTFKNRQWLERYVRNKLLRRFRQLAIYIKLVGPVDTLIIEARRIP
jgi:hypothetical protein